MRRNSTPSIGAIHPILFFMLVYGISLFMALFVCRTVYFSLNKDTSGNNKTATTNDLSYSGVATNATALK
jgi:hypothetical protein